MEYPKLTHILKPDVLLFKQLIRFKSFSQASMVLDREQGTLSKAVIRLEKEMGQKLLIRNPKGFKLTQAGENLMEILQSLEHQENRPDPHTLGKAITLGCHEILAQTYFPTWLPSMMEFSPGTHFDYSFHPSSEITEKVNSGEIDIGLVITPIKNPNLISIKMGTEFSAFWSSGKGDGNIMLIHPDMLMVGQVKRSTKNRELHEIPNYQLIASILKQRPDWIGVLPHPVAQFYQLNQMGPKLFEVQVSLISRKDRFDYGLMSKIGDLLKKN
jgi:hypothetical protein